MKLTGSSSQVIDDTFDDSSSVVTLLHSNMEQFYAERGMSKHQSSSMLSKTLGKVKSSFIFLYWDRQEVDYQQIEILIFEL